MDIDAEHVESPSFDVHTDGAQGGSAEETEAMKDERIFNLKKQLVKALKKEKEQKKEHDRAMKEMKAEHKAVVARLENQLKTERACWSKEKAELSKKKPLLARNGVENRPPGSATTQRHNATPVRHIPGSSANRRGPPADACKTTQQVNDLISLSSDAAMKLVKIKRERGEVPEDFFQPYVDRLTNSVKEMDLALPLSIALFKKLTFISCEAEKVRSAVGAKVPVDHVNKMVITTVLDLVSSDNADAAGLAIISKVKLGSVSELKTVVALIVNTMLLDWDKNHKMDDNVALLNCLQRFWSFSDEAMNFEAELWAKVRHEFASRFKVDVASQDDDRDSTDAEPVAEFLQSACRSGLLPVKQLFEEFLEVVVSQDYLGSDVGRALSEHVLNLIHRTKKHLDYLIRSDADGGTLFEVEANMFLRLWNLAKASLDLGDERVNEFVRTIDRIKLGGGSGREADRKAAAGDPNGTFFSGEGTFVEELQTENETQDVSNLDQTARGGVASPGHAQSTPHPAVVSNLPKIEPPPVSSVSFDSEPGENVASVKAADVTATGVELEEREGIVDSSIFSEEEPEERSVTLHSEEESDDEDVFKEEGQRRSKEDQGEPGSEVDGSEESQETLDAEEQSGDSDEEEESAEEESNESAGEEGSVKTAETGTDDSLEEEETDAEEEEEHQGETEEEESSEEEDCSSHSSTQESSEDDDGPDLAALNGALNSDESESDPDPDYDPNAKDKKSASNVLEKNIVSAKNAKRRSASSNDIPGRSSAQATGRSASLARVDRHGRPYPELDDEDDETDGDDVPQRRGAERPSAALSAASRRPTGHGVTFNDDDAPRLCRGVNKQSEPCKRKVTGTEYCYQHKPK